MSQQSSNDYYPFGSTMAGRGFSQGTYKFGFNGKEQDDEIYGDANAYDFGARVYDARIGRWMSVDPLQKEYVGISPFCFVNNMVIIAIDPDGERIIIRFTEKNNEGQTVIKAVLFHNGKLYDMNGDLYSGNSDYAQKVAEDLNSAKELSGQLERRINKLDRSNKDHYIQMPNRDSGFRNGNEPLDEEAYYQNRGSGTITYFDPDNWESASKEIRNPIIALCHEFTGHGFFKDIGKVIFGETNGVPNFEIQAVRTENIARKAMKAKGEDIKIKTEYNKKSVPEKIKNKQRSGSKPLIIP